MADNYSPDHWESTFLATTQLRHTIGDMLTKIENRGLTRARREQANITMHPLCADFQATLMTLSQELSIHDVLKPPHPIDPLTTLTQQLAFLDTLREHMRQTIRDAGAQRTQTYLREEKRLKALTPQLNAIIQALQTFASLGMTAEELGDLFLTHKKQYPSYTSPFMSGPQGRSHDPLTHSHDSLESWSTLTHADSLSPKPGDEFIP